MSAMKRRQFRYQEIQSLLLPIALYEIIMSIVRIGAFAFGILPNSLSCIKPTFYLMDFIACRNSEDLFDLSIFCDVMLRLKEW